MNFNHYRDSNESFTLIRAILFFFYNQICFHAFVEKHFTFHDENFLKKVIDDQSSLFNKKPIILQFDSNNRREIKKNKTAFISKPSPECSDSLLPPVDYGDCFSRSVHRKVVHLVVNSAGQPRFTNIHNPEKIKLVVTILYSTLLLAPF